MIRGRCPICSKAYDIATIDDLPSFPFCSERCRLIDLGRWVDEKYTVPAKPSPEEGGDDGERELDEAEEYED
jgi:uncharacterized protein